MSKIVKNTVMDMDDATRYFKHFEDYFNKDQISEIDQSLVKNKKINDAIMKIIKTKYTTDDDVFVSFDPAARTMLLMVMKIIYCSASKNEFNIDTKIISIPKGFKVDTVEYMIWTWICGLINYIGDWDDITMNEIPYEFEDVSEYYHRNDEYKMSANSTVFAHTVFNVIIDTVSTKIFNLYSEPTECGAKGLTIKCHMLRGYFTDMNPGCANPEIFMMIHNAAIAFNVIKKTSVSSANSVKKNKKTSK